MKADAPLPTTPSTAERIEPFTSKSVGRAVCISWARSPMTPLMSSAIPSAALTASSPLSSMEPARPLTSISPTHAISFEGEWIPKKSQIPSQMEEIHPDTLSHSHEASWVIPLHSPLTMLPPISTILYIREPKAFTMPAMICGTALTISTMMVGRFSISATNN